MPIDNDDNEVPWVGDSPWDSTDSNTRLPTPEEIASGFACGSADQALFNFVIAYAWGQIYNAMLDAGVTPSLTDLTQLSSIMLLAQNNLSDLDDLNAARVNLGIDQTDNTSDADKPISDDTQDALDLKAPLLSPALTGTPTAPTAVNATSTTQLATTAFVKTSQYNKNVVILSTSGTYTVPSGVYALNVQVWGAGGSGGNTASAGQSGGGGGGGAYSNAVLAVTPGQTISYIIGAGGSNGAGGSSNFGSITANGGAKGGDNGGGGGIGGAATGGTVNLSGGYGDPGQSSAAIFGGAGGFSPMGGVGSSALNNAPGALPGGGGSGKGPSGTGTGAAGANGLIIITY